MKRIISVGLLSAAMLASVNAHATKAELRLIGTITPAACVPNFAGGATIDYGNIPAGTLNATTQTDLPIKTTTINVTCDAPTTFYLKPADERAATVAAGVIPPGSTTLALYGLGSAPGGANIGTYAVQLTGGVADTGTTSRTQSRDGGATWAVWNGRFANDGNQLIGFTNGANANPAPHTTVTADITVTASLAPANTLPLANDITLDGLTTVEVVYP
ncbi:DUF1120 domain-containing protein [Pseudomonas chlororaphis]|uniref:DUF1120 domain-containing protein n=1 Tax=Pseudomonas chlororaphis TaxID=587753 RepID=UPI001389CBA4|nr:DUF1120 domain-containing protein [Pseudomonas chlororaphis]QQX56981.1 DUF1120 domain-containing protein [Pseudomonas chlororaphis subsp. aurantiaca]UVE43836.1 DUF1120 domain-containing protein [Pseudomonas chlororaphis]